MVQRKPTTSTPIDLSSIQRLAKVDLECLLGSSGAEVPKVFIIEQSLDRFLFLGKALDRGIASRYNIREVLPFERESNFKEDPLCHYFFILRPKISTCLALRSILEKALKLGSKGAFLYICFVPHPTIGCVETLRTSTARLLDSKRSRIVSLDIDCLPVDAGLLTMEIATCYNDLFVVKDVTNIKVIARALLKLQAVHMGNFHNIIAHGEISCKTLRMMQALRHSSLRDCPESSSSDDRDGGFWFDALLIVDRSLDLVSPLLSQRTYEGLIDANFEINMGTVELPSHIKDAKGTPYGIVSLWNQEDTINDSLRHLSFGDAGKFLNAIACEIQDEYNDRHEIQDVSELRNFVKSLPATQKRHRLSTMHAAIFEVLAKEVRQKGLHRHFDMEIMIASDEIDMEECLGYLNECIHRSFPLIQVARMIILMRYCSSFWNSHLWRKIKETLVGAYGAVEVIAYVEMIERARWFRPGKMGLSWKEWRKRIGQTTDDEPTGEATTNETVHCPSMITYAFEEYVSHVVCGKDSNSTFDALTDVHSQVLIDTPREDQRKIRVFMLCFVGGASLAEIEAIRAFERAFNEESTAKIRVLVVTTNLVNGKTFLRSMLGDEAS